MQNACPSMGALINYYNDIGMLRHQMESGQFDEYDQICVVDGPYSYTRSLSLSDGDSSLPFHATDVGRVLLADPRVVYRYEVWQDEAQKRIAGYEAMTTDYVMLHDTDEFYAINSDALSKFFESDKAVASFLCQNLCLDGIHFAPEYYAVDATERLPHKAFLFKRDAVSSREHLNFLWLVGVNQSAPDRTKSFLTPVALGYHFTAMRSREGQIQKYTFYSALHNAKHGTGTNAAAEDLREQVANGIIDSKTAISILLRSHPDFLGAPHPAHGFILKRRIKGGDRLEQILHRVASETSIRHSGPISFLQGHSAQFYLEAGKPNQRLDVPDGLIWARSWDFTFDAKAGDLVVVASGTPDSIIMDAPKSAGAHGRLFQIEVRSAGSGPKLLDGVVTDVE